MTRGLPAFVALVIVVALPFVVRPRVALRAADAGAERLVIITPHNEAIRYEFGRAFRAFMAAQGRRVEIDWRTPGGTAEVARFIGSEYTASFQRYWTHDLRRPWSATVASSFMSPSPSPLAEATAAREAFLRSDVGCGLDLLFGGGSVEHIRHARAGRLVDAGLVSGHPELFGPAGIPQQIGGQLMWDPQGRWVGSCVASFGICLNHDSLARLGVPAPTSWRALADPRLSGEIGLADPGKSGTATKAFEIIIQSEMQRAGVINGWANGLRLIRRIGGNARYFTDSAVKVALDVSAGDAAVGTCIDYYGRFQRESLAEAGYPDRVGYIAPAGETVIDADPISLLRGAPHRELAVAFMAFVLSDEGQKLWAFRRGVPGGPQRYTLARLPMLPALYGDAFAERRAPLGENPYDPTGRLNYQEAATGSLFGAIAFVVRAMCVDTEDDLTAAYRSLVAAHFPPRATALFDDVSAVDYATAKGPLLTALRAADSLVEADWSRRLVEQFRAQYRQVIALAEARQ
jgi:iron(III) transport system substrate-binding protein